MNKVKLLRKAIEGSRNIRFADMLVLAKAFGFRVARVSGSHHILIHPGIPELVNLQEVGGKTKPYQVRQFLKLVENHDLRLGENE